MYTTRSSLPGLFAFLALSFGCSAPFNAAENSASDGGAPDDAPVIVAGQAGATPDKSTPTPGSGGAGAAGAPTAGGMAGNAATANADPLPLDAPAPRILQMSPSDGAVGVSPHTRVTLRFSVPMAHDATLAALSFSGPSLSTWDATWDESSTLLSLTPRAPLGCASATLVDDQALEVEAATYTVTLGEGAVDLQGRPLHGFSLHFQTPRRIEHTLHAVSALTGVLQGPSEALYGFLSFDLGQLQGVERHVTAAAIHGDALGLEGPVPIYAADFSELSAGAISAPGKLIATVPAGTGGDLAVPASAFGIFDGRDGALLSRGRYAQMRMALPELPEKAASTGLAAALRGSSLEVEYSLP